MGILGYFLIVLVGFSVGLLGSGGTTLAVPILVYMLGFNPASAIIYSLFIISIATFVGSIRLINEKLFDSRVILYFGMPSLAAVWTTRNIIFPRLPEIFFDNGTTVISKNLVVMVVFALLMIWSAYSMIFRKLNESTRTHSLVRKSIIPQGIIVGVLSGLVGVGGGFLIIPTLIFNAHLPMKQATAISILLIFFNSSVGFLGSMSHQQLDYPFLLILAGLASMGVFSGIAVGRKVDATLLRKIFGCMVLSIGLFILFKEL